MARKLLRNSTKLSGMSSQKRDRTLPAFRAMMEVCSQGDDLSFARCVEMLRSVSRPSSPAAPGCQCWWLRCGQVCASEESVVNATPGSPGSGADPSDSHVAQSLSRHAGPEPDFPAHGKDPSGKSVAKDVARAGMLKSRSWTEGSTAHGKDPSGKSVAKDVARAGVLKSRSWTEGSTARAGAMRKSRSCVSFSSDIQLREFDAVPEMRVTFSSDSVVREMSDDSVESSRSLSPQRSES